MTIPVPSRLITAVRNRQCIPFVGAGLSRQASTAHFPTWHELLLRMTAEAANRNFINQETKTELITLLTQHKHLMVAEHLKQNTPRDFYYTFVQTQFQSTHVEPAEAHKLLINLNPRLIITTNYDRLLEDAFAHERQKTMTVMTYCSSSFVQRRLQDDGPSSSPFLFKIHGDIEDPSQLILAESDYRKLLFAESGYRTLLASLFIHYTVLFLGFSFTDEELLLTLAELRWSLKTASHPDYILLPASSCSSVQTNRFRDDYGIEVITYDDSPGHAGVIEFLRELYVCCN